MFHQHSSRSIRALILLVCISVLSFPTPVIAQGIHSDSDSVDTASTACTFFDDFADNDAEWYTAPGPQLTIAVADGEYKWQMNRGEDLGVSISTGVSGSECANFHLEVDTSVISTGYSSFKPNVYRLRFGDNYYFDIYYDGTFALTHSYGDELLRSGPLPASFNAPPVTNRLFVNVYNGQIVVGANGVPFAVYSDPGFASGWQGVGVGVYSAETHEVHFDNFSQTPSTPYPYIYLPLIVN
jgi:hypothetical protein